MLLREMLAVNKREHLALYSLASLANLLLSVPQFQAVSNSLQLGIHVKGITGKLIAQYGSTIGLALEFASEILIFQGIMAVLTIGISVIASARTRRRWAVLDIGHLGGFISRLLSRRKVPKHASIDWIPGGQRRQCFKCIRKPLLVWTSRNNMLFALNSSIETFLRKPCSNVPESGFYDIGPCSVRAQLADSFVIAYSCIIAPMYLIPLTKSSTVVYSLGA